MFRWMALASLLVVVLEMTGGSPGLVDVPETGSVPASPAPAVLPEGFALGAQLYATGFQALTGVFPLPGTEKMLAMEKDGRVQVIVDGGPSDQLFMDITQWVRSDGNEEGLLSVVFHPDFPEDRRVFLFYTDQFGDSQLAMVEARRDLSEIDPASFQRILKVRQKRIYHQSGSMTFGPGGMLWVSLGDGGGIGDPESYGQDPRSLNATIIRIGVDGGMPYEIPSDNPFIGDDDGRNEVWAFGVRNPWRISIDEASGMLLVPDAGQVDYEEINVVPVGRPAVNFGWSVTEGPNCFNQEPCDPVGTTEPVHGYPHEGDGCAIIGGRVYRGNAIPEIVGHYFYADFCIGWVKSVALNEGMVIAENDWRDDLGELGHVTTFGTDLGGELYVTNLEGEIYKIVPGS